MLSPNRSKKGKPVIFILLILFLGGVFYLGSKSIFKFFSPPKKDIVTPVVSLNEEEKLEEVLRAAGFGVLLVKSLDGHLEATLSGNLFVLFSREKEYPEQVASLQFIVSRSKIEGKMPRKIDLRFNKPVLTY